MKKHLFLFILTLITCFAGNLYAGTIDLLSSGYSTTSWSSSYNSGTKTITFSNGWGGYGWWVNDYDCSDWISITLTYETPSGKGRIRCEYKDGSPSDNWVSINENGSNLTSATLTFAATNIKQVYVQLENAGDLVLTSAYVTTADPAEPFHQMIATGTSTNITGSGIGGSGDGSTYTFSSVSDPIRNFDHNVLQVSYDMKNISDNDVSYKGRYLVRDDSYTTNTDATGYAFWYMTENSTDQIYMEIKEKDNSGYTFKLAATDGCWKYVYRAADHAHNGTSYEYEMWVNGKKDNFASGSNTGKFYFTEFQVTNVTSDDDVCSSCTAPAHVDISGRWDRFGGETISLTATAYSSAGTGSPIADANITGWQWQKLISTTWTDVSNGADGTATISGATTKNLQISNCHMDNSGKYRCVVSTGATCSTASATATDGSEGYRVRVYTLEHYTGGTTQYNFTRIGDTQTGSVEVTLSANTGHQFKIHGDEYFGNNGTINFDENNWTFTSSGNNVTVNSGLGGTFTFTIDYSSNGAVPVLAVTYPRKAVYLNPNADWKKDNAKFAFYYFHKTGETTNKEGWTDFLSPSVCDGNVYPATIPQWNGVQIIGVRFNSTKTSTGNFDDKWNQTSDLTLTSNDLVTITGWDNSQTYNSSYDAPEYTITFAGNGSTSGSMTNVEDIECEGDVTLEENGYVKTGYAFTGWKDDSSNDYADKATISDIKADIELTAQWSAETYNITLDKGDHGAADQAATVVYNTEVLATFTTVAANKGYTLNGYYDGSTKVLNADGSFAGSAVTGYITSSKWTKAADCMLTAKWTAKTTSITLDANGGDSDGSAIATFDSNTLTDFSAAAKDGYSCTGYWDATTDGNRIINSNGTLVASTDSTDASGNWTCAAAAVTLYAQWTQNKYELTLSDDGHGEAASDQLDNTQILGGTTVTITPTPDEGYVFDYWTIDGAAGGSSNPLSLTMDDNHTVQAHFALPPHVVNCALDFYYTEVGTGAQDKVIFNSDFSYNSNKDNIKNDQHGSNHEVCFSDGGAPYTATSRRKVTFPIDGGYTFTFPLYINGDNQTYPLPTVTVNGFTTASENINTDGRGQFNYTHTKTLSSVTAGTYTLTVNIGSTNEKIFLSTLNISKSVDLSISSLPWSDSQALNSEGVLVTSAALAATGMTHVIFTFTGSETVKYYDYADLTTSLGTVTSGKPVALTSALKSHGIYLLCTSGSATLTKAEEVITVTGSTELSSTSVSHLIIHQGGEVTNTANITITGSIAYHRPATTLDQWFTFAVPFSLTGIQVQDVDDSNWYDINAVYYTTDNADQSDNNPTGLGHFYLKYLRNDGVNQMTNDRWMYIDPAHSDQITSDNGTRSGYPKKNQAYIILFDSKNPIGNYFERSPNVRFVGGAQTVDGTFDEPVVYEGDDKGYGLYANTTLHRVTLTNDAYIMSEDGTRFDLEENPTIKPFECYIQATEEFKLTYASIPMRHQGGDTPTAIEDIELNDTSRTIKVLRQGHLIIIRNGHSYDIMGARVR